VRCDPQTESWQGGAPYCARCFADLKQPNLARGTAPSVTRAGLCCSHAVRTGGSLLRCRPAGNPTGRKSSLQVIPAGVSINVEHFASKVETLKQA